MMFAHRLLSSLILNTGNEVGQFENQQLQLTFFKNVIRIFMKFS